MRRIGAALVVVAGMLAPLAAQNGDSAWVTWARANHHPIAAVQSFEGDTFDDLQFFKTVLKDRRIVQLGESGHGVAEFNHAKVRLIKFLHQHMGFDVIAFESGLFECYQANATPSLTADALMRRCIFAVWHTEEVAPLFEYIKQTQSTSRPLTLAGFDTQMGSSQGLAARPAFFANLVRAIEPARADAVATRDLQYLLAMYSGGNRETYARANEAVHADFYGGLESFFQEHRARLEEAFGPELPRVGEKAAFSMLRYLEQLRAGSQLTADRYAGAGAIRDFGMANNLTFLANDLYPGRKILVWAHNGHIRHDNAGEHERALPTMGQWIRERFRDELYTIGLYMNQGTAANNDRSVYAISPGDENTMEWILARAGAPVLFMDFLAQAPAAGNSWMFERTLQREWGRNPPFPMVPRNQYDGVLFVDLVTSPSYLPFQ